MRTNSQKIKKITLIALFVAIISIISQIAIPTPSGVYIALQLFVVMLTGYFFKPKESFLIIIVYILLGAIGAPVFSGFKGGFHVLLGPSGGFILGFIFVAILCSVSPKSKIAILIGIASVILCHLLGIIQYMIISGTSFVASLISVSLPFILKDLLLAPVSYVLYKKISKSIKR